jgi:oxygen-dependent protoporphyrinogen oxidase
VIFEAAGSVGGRTRTWRAGELTVDSGAGFFTNFYPTLSKLIEPLGLRDAVVELSRSNVLVEQGVRAELSIGSIRSFLRFPLLDWREKAQLARESARVAVLYRRLDLSAPETLCALDDRSVKDEAVARLGERVYEIIVRSGIEPFWYFSCEEVSRALALALHARAATARFYTFASGMDTVCQALTKGIETRLGQAVAPLERADGGFWVGPDGEAERFDDVVVATTASVARKLVGKVVDAVPPPVATVLETQRYVPNVHAVFQVPRARCPEGLSAIFPAGRGDKRLAALSFNSHKHQGADAETRTELVSVFLTAKESAAALGLSEAQLFERAWGFAREMCPELPSEAEPMWVIARPEAIPIHAVGRYRLAAEASAAQRAPIVFAGDYLATATVDGALRSGIRAAEHLSA